MTGRISHWVLAAVTLLAASGCWDAPLLPPDGGAVRADGGPNGPTCSSRTACEEGEVCRDGICQGCQRDRECLGTEICNPVIHRCEFLECFGGDCSEHPDCSLGEFCVQGLCRQPEGDDVCGSVRACGNTTDCEPEERCNPETLVCEVDTGCFGDAACPDGFYCDLATNSCARSCTEENVDEVCAEGFRCASGRCVECAADADCGAGLTCDLVTARCGGTATCFGDRDCVRPLVCNRATGKCTERPPPCVSNDDCLPAEVCEIRTGRCVDGSCLPDALEPNDVFEDAALIEPGLISNLTLCDQEEDWYLVALGAGDRMSANVNPPPLSGSNFSVRLYEPSGAQVIAAGNLLVDHTVTTEGNYPIRVRSTDLRASYSVQLLVSRGIPCEDDLHEPNGSFTEAARLEPGSHFNLQKCPGNADFFEIEVPRGSAADFVLFHTPLEGDLDLFVFDSDGATLLGKSETTEPEEAVSIADTSGGRAFLEVRAAPRTQNAYDLTVEIR